MYPGFVRRVLVVATAVLLLVPAVAGAAEKTPFLDAVNGAYPHLKMSWFYSRTGSGDVAALEIGAFQDAWAEIAQKFAAAPPPRFAGDKRWRQSISAVTATTAKALAECEAGRLKEAHRMLGEVRSALSDLRRRNSIVLFTDHVEAYGVQVARLSRLRTQIRKAGKLTPEALEDLGHVARALRTAVQNISNRAPADLLSDPAFRASIEGNFKSVSLLERGVRRKNLRAVTGSVSAVRSDYVLLYIRYG